MNRINFTDFQKIEIRIGKILEVERFPEAKIPAYKLKIDFGEFGVRTSSAQITKKYSKKKLIGKLVVCVANFYPKQIANFISEVLVLGVESREGVVLLNIDEEVEIGKRIC